MRAIPRLAFAAALLAASATAQEAPRPPSPGPLGVPLFAAPAFFEEAEALAAHTAAGRMAQVQAGLAGLRAQAPGSPLPELMAASAAMAAGNTEGAIAGLERAAALGMPDLAGVLALPAFDAIRADPRVAALAARAAPPPSEPTAVPAPVTARTVTVEAGNTAWDPQLRRLVSRFAFSERPPRPLLLDVRPDDSPEGQRLARMVARGAAAGHWGDLYDNRDRGHSRLRAERYPLLTAVTYDEEATAAGVDYGVAEQMLFDAVTFGNSSTAYTARSFWRSLPRLAMTRPGGPEKLWDLYTRNHLYVYPEHRDHDEEHGDLYPANTPYMIVSQGSSGSDRAHLHAIAVILAALRPDTKAYLRDTGLIAPTVQMLYRRHRAGIVTYEDYLGGAAHPSVFTAEGIDPIRLLEAANALRPEAVPPMVRLAVLEEGPAGPPAPPLPGGDAGEVLFDTPGAIARIARGLAHDRRYRLTASDTVDPNGNPLRFVWRVLRGEGVRVTPLDPRGVEAVIEVPWQTEQPVPGRPELRSSRVDIGVFAHNGMQYSAPAFFSVHFSQDQTRHYDAAGRLLSVDYATPARPGAYADPWLYPYRGWRDIFDWGGDGTLLGWRREQRQQPDRYFGPDGTPLAGPRGRRLGEGPVVYTLGPRRDRDGRQTVLAGEG